MQINDHNHQLNVNRNKKPLYNKDNLVNNYKLFFVLTILVDYIKVSKHYYIIILLNVLQLYAIVIKYYNN